MRRLFATLILLGPLVALAADVAGTPVEQARALFERDWQWRLKHQPEFATSVGDNRYAAQLSDTSLAASAAFGEHARRMLDLARQIDRAQLAGQDRLSWDVFTADQERILARSGFVAFDPQPISAQDGLQIRFPQLVAQMPFFTEDDYRNYIARLNALPRHVDGIIEQMRDGMRTGWTAPKAIITGLPAQLRALREHLQDGALGAPFQRLPSTIPEETRTQLALDATAALRTAAGALQKLEDFVRTDYLPAARPAIGASSLPGGAAWYAYLVKTATTTALAPADIHALGEREVARIQHEMAALAPKLGYDGPLKTFPQWVAAQPRFKPFTSDREVLDRYRAIYGAVEAKLPQYFSLLPKAKLDIQLEPELTRATASDHYTPVAADGSHPGVFWAVVNDPKDYSTVGMTSLLLHEGVPGHHLHAALLKELPLPDFRKFFTEHPSAAAYTEGWALYCETLGREFGLYDDPAAYYGHLNDELLRAVRLVVDTGMHAQGWSREKAVAYMMDNLGYSEPRATNQVERYMVWPGQALAYKVGALKILDLRARAQKELGPKFSFARFHEVVLGDGTLPLPILRAQVEKWIAAEK